MTFNLPSGESVELVSADAYSGPGDCFSKLHVNSTANWWRVLPDGEWRLVRGVRSRKHAIDAIGVCESAEEVLIMLGESES